MRLSQEQAEAISSMLREPKGQHLLAYLGQVAEEENKALIHAKDGLERRQGRTQMAVQILETILGAEETLNQYKQPQT